MEQKNNAKIETVCFTGHREMHSRSAAAASIRLKALLRELIARGATHFRAGGAIGFDTLAALCVLELQEEYPHIKLDLILPCPNQTKYWKEDDTRMYDYIMTKASSVMYVSDHFTNYCMMQRNRRLVEGSQVCIAYLTKSLNSKGGTSYTFGYAIKQGLETYNVAENIK